MVQAVSDCGNNMFFKLFKSRNDPKDRGAEKKARSRRVKHKQNKQNRVEKIPVDQLRPGMFVRELDIPWEDSTFLFQGVTIESQSDVLEVQKQCKHVWVDYTEYQLVDSKKGAPSTAFASNQSLLEVEEAYPEARDVHEQVQQVVKKMFSDIRLGGEIDVTTVKQSISSSVSSILQNPDASIWLTRLREKDDHIGQHVMNVAALSIIAGRALDLSNNDLQNLGVCALMHDVGKSLLPLELINRSGTFNEVELGLMRTHPQLGHDILSQAKNIYSGAAIVALSHHENFDGSGYPRGLKGDDIPLFARIVAIADAYDSMTTKQAHRDAYSPTQALDELYAKRDKQFDSQLVLKFIDGIGIFPPGSIVEMTNGEVGIVLSTTNEKLNPRVIMILDKNKDASVQQMVDLSQLSIDSDGQAYQIKTTLADGAFGIVVDEFQRAGLRIG